MSYSACRYDLRFPFSLYYRGAIIPEWAYAVEHNFSLLDDSLDSVVVKNVKLEYLDRVVDR